MFQNKFLLSLSILAVMTAFVANIDDKPEKPLPYSGDEIKEFVVNDHGKKAVRIAPDVSLNFPELMKNRNKCFILMSKKDYYLYVYEPQGTDTVMLARFDCCFGLKKGNKQKRGDMKTPHCTFDNPFTISQIQDASTWTHNFGDGRGTIKAYGNYFLRLVTPGHSGIGIHGSTNNAESVPGRASEGCIRLRDNDIITLAKTYAYKGMKVYIKDELAEDMPFEIRAMKKQNIQRVRHLDPKSILTNDQIENATVLNASTTAPLNLSASNRNMTLEQFQNVNK